MKAGEFLCTVFVRREYATDSSIAPGKYNARRLAGGSISCNKLWSGANAYVNGYLSSYALPQKGRNDAGYLVHAA